MKRTRHGLTLVCSSPGRWVTEDGRGMVDYDDQYLSTCDEAHPVRLTADLARSIRAYESLYPAEAASAVRYGRKGYLCPGGEEHPYGEWASWVGADVIDRGGSMDFQWRQLAAALAKGVGR